MDMSKDSPAACPVASGVACVGDAWSLLILRDASRGVSRFDQFRASLGIAPNILASRLAALTENGLLERRLYCKRPPRHEYALTAAGRDFLPVLILIGEWARRQPGGDRLAHFVDAATGEAVRPVLIDEATGESLAGRAVTLATPDA